jgi:hypothetical protein
LLEQVLGDVAQALDAEEDLPERFELANPPPPARNPSFEDRIWRMGPSGR